MILAALSIRLRTFTRKKNGPSTLNQIFIDSGEPWRIGVTRLVPIIELIEGGGAMLVSVRVRVIWHWEFFVSVDVYPCYSWTSLRIQQFSDCLLNWSVGNRIRDSNVRAVKIPGTATATDPRFRVACPWWIQKPGQQWCPFRASQV